MIVPNFLEYFLVWRVADIIADRNQFLGHIDKEDLESIKLQIKNYADLLRLCKIQDSETKNLHGSFLNYALKKKDELSKIAYRTNLKILRYSFVFCQTL